MHACYLFVVFYLACMCAIMRPVLDLDAVCCPVSNCIYISPHWGSRIQPHERQLHTMCFHSSSPPTPPRLSLPLPLSLSLSLSKTLKERAKERDIYRKRERERELRKRSCRKDRRDRLHVETLIFSVHSHNKHEYTISLVCLSQGILGHG